MQFVDVSIGSPIFSWEAYCLDNYMTQWVNEHPECTFDASQKSWLVHDVSPRDSYIRLAWMIENGREEEAVDRILELARDYIW